MPCSLILELTVPFEEKLAPVSAAILMTVPNLPPVLVMPQSGDHTVNCTEELLWLQNICC